MSRWGRGSTRASRKLREQILRREPDCTCTGCRACTPDGCERPSVEDDHHVPLSQGGSEHPDNHRGICTPCHRVKSDGEAVEARRTTYSRKRAAPKHPGSA